VVILNHGPLLSLSAGFGGLDVQPNPHGVILWCRDAADYFDDSELVQLQTYLAAHPTAGDVVPATGGVRKLRWSRLGMGKRGGLRILYYVQDAKGRIWLLT
jgi:hypothetical protein